MQYNMICNDDLCITFQIENLGCYIHFQLLVEEQLTMWIDAPAVKCYDAYKKEILDLHAMLVHTIQDMSALGNTSGRKQREM